MRGKALAESRALAFLGITPAYAGKRYEYDKVLEFCKDHPRLCGEKGKTDGIVQQIMGSPPPMRGKVVFDFRLVSYDGITPAYAGKSLPLTVLLVTYEDHPRLCGEKVRLSKKTPFWAGSPPPMRGKDCRTVCEVLAFGITPAYAGKRLISSISAPPR